MRVRIWVAYEGTNYHGWQKQKDDPLTIEAQLNGAISDLFGTPIEVIGASRTDAGVHAKGNVAVFDVETRMPAEKVSFALNQRLPEDIRIQGSQEVEENWHPRHVPCRKTYEYHTHLGTFPMPIGRQYCHFLYGALDIKKMRQAAAFLMGEHDFTSFSSVKTKVTDFVRTIYSLEVEQQGDDLVIRVQGNGFLYNMVRIIAGTLLEVGLGRMAPEAVEKILQGKNRELAGPTAPAKGLTLCTIEYEENG